ncbi:unnamed protein product [Acanthoscelides obtectus]|uniref:Uncharacterized protein n=1 Tax=Acanthoscelides obtectus TaxID=200917 RepID=A0A9P0JPX2_ACAOB|nr:unnamed protein product [Acanthoscelides obtectus]CAK1621167.1 hypothetical protein AOBTE_LOCUS804 [Acanthoscelides obtectus]
MTVNEYKEATCATAGAQDDMEIEENVVVAEHHQNEAEGENLLGRVLAGVRRVKPCLPPFRSMPSSC